VLYTIVRFLQILIGTGLHNKQVQSRSHAISLSLILMLWHVDPLLLNDHEIASYSVTDPYTSMFPWQQLHCNRGILLFMQSVPRCYKQNKLRVSALLESVGWWVSKIVRGLIGSSCCELLLDEWREENICCWKLWPSNSSEGMTVDTIGHSVGRTYNYSFSK
jgi:hypothetical protein